MIETQGNEPNLRYGFIPEDTYQNLKIQDFSIRLDAAQILNKSVLALSPLAINELPKDNVISFFEFSRQFLIDENFGVINCFNEILDYFFEYTDKSILRENLNMIIGMLIPPLQDKRYAVRNISSNLIIKYSTVLESTELLEHLTSIFYDQPASSQIEILNIVGRYLSNSDNNLDDDNFNQKIVGLIESSFLILNANVRSASIRLLRQIQQSNQELFKLLPENIQKVTETEGDSKITASRIPRTPNSSLPPIYMSFNAKALKQKIQQSQQTNPKAPDTASSKKRTDEFWYRSKPRFAKTAGFIIGKTGKASIQPSTQQFASTNSIPNISKNIFVRTPDAVFQPQESYSPLVTDEGAFYSNSNQNEQVHAYDPEYKSIGDFDHNIKRNKNKEEEESDEESSDIFHKSQSLPTYSEYDGTHSNHQQQNTKEDESNDMNNTETYTREIKLNERNDNENIIEEEEVDDTDFNQLSDNDDNQFNYTSIEHSHYNENSHIDSNIDQQNAIENTENDDETESKATEFDEFDSMPAPRIVPTIKKRFNRASLININEQTDLGTEEKQFDERNPSSGREPRFAIEDQENNNNLDHSSSHPFQRNRRQYKPRPPSLPPSSSPPPLFISKCAEVANVFSSGFEDASSCDTEQQGALNIKKLSYRPGGASFRARKPPTQVSPSTATATASSSFTARPKASPKSTKSGSSVGSSTSSNSKPDLQSLISDLQSSSDWEKQNTALIRLQTFITNSPSFVSTNLRVLSFEVVPLCSSIRSALSKTALECLTSIASSFGSEMTPFFEAIVNDLLTILLSSRGFITRLASSCISTILHNVSRKRAIEYLTGDHKKRPGSCKATLSMCLEELLGDDDENGENLVSAEVIKSIGSFITDANPEARKHARGALKILASKDPSLAYNVSSMKIDESTKKVVIDAIQK